MAVTHSADSGAVILGTVSAAGSGNTNLGITVGVGDTFLLVGIEAEVGAATDTISLVWDTGGTNQAMTQIGSNLGLTGGTAPSVSALFGLVSPTVGLKNILATDSGSGAGQSCYMYAISFKGTVTTSVAAATEAYAKNNGTGTTASVSSASAIPSSDMATAFWIDAGAGISGTWTNGGAAPDGGTAIGVNLGLSNNAAAEYYQGAGSVISGSAPLTGTDIWGAHIVGIKAPGGAAAQTPYNPWPQLGPVTAQKRKSVGWLPLYDHRRRILRPKRFLILPNRKAA